MISLDLYNSFLTMLTSIDGHSAFHSVGGIACVTTPPGAKDTITPVSRMLNVPSLEIVGCSSNVPNKIYKKLAIVYLKSITVENVTLTCAKPNTLKSANA